MTIQKQLTSWRAVIEAYQVCNQQFSKLLVHYYLTPSQFDVLLAIHNFDGEPTPNELAKKLLVSKGNITSVTKRLVDRELIIKTQHNSDARSFNYKLSETGVTLTMKAKAAAKAFIKQQLLPFNYDELHQVEMMMNAMKRQLKAMDINQILNEVGEKCQ